GAIFRLSKITWNLRSDSQLHKHWLQASKALLLSFCRHKVHVRRVIQDAAAIRAGHNLLLPLAGPDDLNGQLHVATATNTMFDTNDGIISLGPAQTLVTIQHSLIDADRQPVVIVLEFC